MWFNTYISCFVFFDNTSNFRKFIFVSISEEYELTASNSRIVMHLFVNRGFRPLHPDLLFVLKQKVSKKFKTAPASLEKLAFDRLNRPNSPQLFLKLETVEQAQTRTIFNAALSDFSAHRTRSPVSNLLSE